MPRCSSSPASTTSTARITPAYAEPLGISAADATRSYRLVVKKEENFRPATRRAPTPRPAAQEPSTAAAGAVAGTKPDLRSLPAFGMNISGNGNYLRFFATVWNGGDSPLVVDGFRRADEDVMDAYQYFFDGDGQQTGYQKVGAMHWDARSTHQHWHFEDFARYALLDASKVEAVRSKKEAFCLAPTDAVDLTVPNAAWNVENSDLATACGDNSALSIREVLASGWGDTYAQFRAGQSFDLRGPPERHLLRRGDRQPRREPGRGGHREQHLAAQGEDRRPARCAHRAGAAGRRDRGVRGVLPALSTPGRRSCPGP